MNWKQINFDWNKAKAFLATAEAGTFSAASKLLKLTQPTLGRQVAALEEELGVALFEKIGKSLELTPSGLELLEHVRKMAEAANTLALTASGQATDIEGTVSISASEAYSVHLLPKLITKLREQQPKIQVEIIASNESSDLRRREADIALRNFRTEHQDLIAKKLGDSPYSLYASPVYLQSLPSIKKKSDLSNAQFIGIGEPDQIITHLNRMGVPIGKRNFSYLVNNHLVHWELVKAGAGIGFITEYIGDQEPTVQKILPGHFPDMTIENWLVSHRDLKNSRRIRVVFDFLYKELTRIFR